MRRFLLPSLLLPSLLLLPMPAWAGDLDAFARRLAALGQRTRTLQARFVQRKRLRLFKTEVTTRGRIEYRRPDRLRWETLPPDESLILVRGHQAELRLPSEAPRVIDLRRNRAVGTLVEQMLVWLGGRPVQDLKRWYSVALSLDGDRTVVRLTPREATLKQQVKQIVARFSQDLTVQQIQVLQPEGDSTLITFEEVRRNQT